MQYWGVWPKSGGRRDDMASARYGGVVRQIHRLFDRGSVAGLAEAQLLERFADDQYLREQIYRRQLGQQRRWL